MFIAIEWVDWAWKATQTKLLVENLKKSGYSADSITFPAYWEWSCRFVENFLHWVYGHPSDLNWYISSSFYILDRFEQSPKIKEKMTANDFLISDRYSVSNFIHRWTKYLEDNDTEWLYKFFDWVYDFEFEKALLPKPDLIVFLSLSMENISKMIQKKTHENRWYIHKWWLDLAEQDVRHQECSLMVWKEYLPKYFHNYVILECEDESWNMLSAEDISKKLLDLVLSKRS
jgi:thymidylate kinase